MSIDDLLAFAAGAQLTIESNAMVTIDDDLAARTGLDPQPAGHDVEGRVVVAVVVPPGDGARLGVDGARPHRLGVQGHLSAHPRRRVGRAERIARDVGAGLGCEVQRLGLLRHAPIKPPRL
jgi:hypothetical protein